MIPVDRRKLGAIALIVSGMAAFAAPFLFHAPPLAANSGGGGGPGPTTGGQNNHGGQNPSPPGPTTPPAQHKKTLKDAWDKALACGHDNRGSQQSVLAKLGSAMRSDHSTRTDNHLNALTHQLDTPAAAKHLDNACLDELKDIVKELMESS